MGSQNSISQVAGSLNSPVTALIHAGKEIAPGRATICGVRQTLDVLIVVDVLEHSLTQSFLPEGQVVMMGEPKQVHPKACVFIPVSGKLKKFFRSLQCALSRARF